MRNYILIIASIFLIFELFSTAQRQTDRNLVIKVTKISQCKSNSRMQLYDILLDQNGKKDSTFSFNVTIQGGPYYKPKVLAEFIKCVYEDEQCEHFIKIKHGLCKAITDKNQVYTPFFEALEPRLTRCPINSGKYVLRNGSFSFNYLKSAFNFVLPQSLLDAFWKVIVRYSDDDKGNVGCYYVHSQIKEFRRI